MNRLSLKLTRWFLPSLLVVFLTLFFVTPVMAIDEPDSLDIEGVWVYSNCREVGDQLYLIEYAINATPIPSETAHVAYICRLMEGASELASTTPFAYYNKGYGDGVIAFYFEADDAPTWEGFFTMQLVGNPFLSWNASVPSTTYSPFDVWQDNDMTITRSLVSGRIVTLAQDLEDDWGQDMVNLSDSGEQVLTTYAVSYFINVVPYFAEVAPYVFADDQTMSSTTMTPVIPPEEEYTDFSDQLAAMIPGTAFDLTPAADWLGIGRGALTTVIYYGFILYIVIRLSRDGKSTRPIMLFSIPLVIMGAYVGVPLIVTVLAGLAALFFTLWSLLFKPSPA